MTLPIAPTVTTLCTDAYQSCGIENPTTAQLMRAENWLEEILRDIASGKDFHSVEETLVVIPQAYLQVYAMPTPLIQVHRMRFYRGTEKGLATAGGVNTLTVATGTGNAQWAGRKLFLISGTGAAQSGRITAVSGDVVTISCNWDTVPMAGTGYLIADSETPVHGPTRAFRLDGITPGSALTAWDFIESNLRFSPALDNAGEYALEIDGIVDIGLIDKDDTRRSRIYREWQKPIRKGLRVRIMETQDDASVNEEEVKYERSILKVMKQDRRKRMRAEAPGFRSIGGTVRRRY